MPATHLAESPLSSSESSDPVRRGAFRLNKLITEHGRRDKSNGEMQSINLDLQQGDGAQLYIGFSPRHISPEASRQYEQLVASVPTDSARQAAEMLSQAYDFIDHSDGETARPASFIVNKRGELAWSSDTDNGATGLVLVRGDGSAEHLGANGDIYGVIDNITAKDILYMLPNSLIGAMKDTDQFDKDGLKQAFVDTDEQNEMTRVRFNEAVPNTVDDFKAAHQTKTLRTQRQNEARARKPSQPAMYEADSAKLTELHTSATTSTSPVADKPKRMPKHALDVEPTSTPSERTPKHRLGTGGIEVIHEDIHYTIKTASGTEVSVTDKRKWRDLPVYPLTSEQMPKRPDYQPFSSAKNDTSEAKHRGKHVAHNKPLTSVIDMFYAAQAEADRKAAADVSGVPAKPDHDPAVHLNADSADDSSRFNLGQQLASRYDAWRFMQANKREAKGLSRNRFDLDNKNTLLKAAIGVTAIVLAARLGWELRGDEVSYIPAPGASGGPVAGEAAPGALTPGSIDPIQERVIAQHAEILNSPANIIPTGGGGEQFTAANGVDKSLWYQYQNEFMQKYPNESYRMLDGNIGFSRPGELSDEAKQFWAQKFGKWL